MARITGKIHDQNMAPVIGAPVSVIEADAPHADLAAMSDENGCYTLGGLTPGRYTIGARGVTARAEIVEDADETRCDLVATPDMEAVTATEAEDGVEETYADDPYDVDDAPAQESGEAEEASDHSLLQR